MTRTDDRAAEHESTGTVAGRDEVLRFGAVWLTSVISGMGSALTTFVFGVWIILETGSAVAFALAMLCATVPPILLGPISGVVVDRFNRRWVLIITDSASAVAVTVIASLVFTGQAQVWHFYLATVVSSAGGVFHLTAYSAMTPLLIPKRHLARANGLMQVTVAVTIAAPLLAAGILPLVGFAGVLVLDLATFALAMTTLLVVRLPRRILWAEQPATPPPLLKDLMYGWQHLGTRPGLRSLVLMIMCFNFCFAAAALLVRPLILSFGTVSTLGVLLFVGGSGMFAGGIVMGVWGGPKRRVRGMALFSILGGVALAAHSLRPSAVLIGVCAFAFLFTLPVVQALFRTVVQVKVDPSALGRVMGTVNTLAGVPAVVAYLLVAPLAEYALEPAMQPGGALAGSLGQLLGTGPGRGLAAVFLVCGLLMGLLGTVAARLGVLRRVDTDLPDALPDAPERTERADQPEPADRTESADQAEFVEPAGRAGRARAGQG